MEIQKAIIPVAGLGTRLLPLTKVFPKELLPLVDKPLVQYAVEELKAAGVKDIIFVVNSNRKFIGDYFKKSPSLEKLLTEQGKDEQIEKLKEMERAVSGISFSYATDKPLGDGHAVLQARKLVGDSPCFVVYPDDIIDSDTPAAEQLAKVFKTANQPVMGLYRLPEEKLSSYGVVGVEPIAKRLSKITTITEKPAPGTAPSNLAIIGRRIITPEVFDYLKKAKANKKGEVVLTEVFAAMVQDGKIVYGYEIEGKWLECGDIASWLQSTLTLLVQHPEYGEEARAYLKEQNLT